MNRRAGVESKSFLGHTLIEPRPSVIFRKGPLTAEDYDEAIQTLIDAKTQLKANADHCHVCGDSCCWAGNCHHNPLLAARKWAEATNVFRCYHCGFIATNDREAQIHFGRTEDEFAMCLIERARMKETATEEARAVEAFCGGVEVTELPAEAFPRALELDIGPDSP